MAGRKREGIEGLKSTTGGKRREDRQVVGKTFFEPINIDAKNVLTVIYLLKSPEENVMLRAVASLEVFGSKDPENFKLLCSLGIFQYLYPLVYQEDNIVKRFTLKLIGMLSGFEEFREQMLGVEDVLQTFVDILRKESDVVLQEFAALTLAELTRDPQAASEFLKVHHSIETLFERIVSPDPDIEKNCLDVMNHILNDINGIESIVQCPSFDISLILNLTTSHYPTIQALTVEVLKQLTSMCRNKKVLLAFRNAKGVEAVLHILQTEEWFDLHQATLDLLLNIVECAELCEYLQMTGCLRQLISLLDSNPARNFMRKILGILSKFSQTKQGTMALFDEGMYERFSDYVTTLVEDDEIILTHACFGIANMVQLGQTLGKATKNPVYPLTEIISNPDRSLNLRNVAAYTVNVLTKVDQNSSRILVDMGAYKPLCDILLQCSNLCTELCHNVIQVFVGISNFDDLKVQVISEPFFAALIGCLPESKDSSKDSSLQVDALECLSEYMTEQEARVLFQAMNGVDVVINCLSSKFASVREWAGYLTAVASQNVSFVKEFITKNGLDWMISERSTIHAMPSWRSAIESIFSNYLPAKFAYTGRLGFQDVTDDGFYIYSNPRSKFMVLEDLLKMQVSPIVPVYIANFGLSLTSSDSCETSLTSSKVSVATSEDVRTSEKPAQRRRVMEPTKETTIFDYPSVDCGRHAHPMKEKIVGLEKCLPDPYLQTYLKNLKKIIEEEEALTGDEEWTFMHPDMIRNRVKTIAKYVEGEMSGPEPDLTCTSPYKEAHLKEMKFFLGTSIVPLGAVRMGGYLERAMLFKVLADRIGFPCSLVRGSFGRAWIEIAIPIMNVEGLEEIRQKSKAESVIRTSETEISNETFLEEGEAIEGSLSSNTLSLAPSNECFWYPKICVEDFKCFPHQFLKPNAMVDLIIIPGRIFPLDSVEAEEYRGNFVCCAHAP